MKTNQSLNNQIGAALHSQQSLRSSLVKRIVAHPERPIFVLAPHNSGQDELLKAYFEKSTEAITLALYKVGEEGVCQLIGQNELRQSSGNSQDYQEAKKGCATRLALISSLPWLEDDAAEHFSDALDQLLSAGNRVVVFCPVQNDRYENLQGDRLEISAQELRQGGYFSASAFAPSLKVFLTEFLPIQVRLAALLAVVLGQTSLEELEGLGYAFPSDIPELLASLHPLFTATDSGKGIHADPVALCHIKYELCQVLSEYLVESGQPVTTAILANRITALSICLLQKDNLETSHQVLVIVEELLSRGMGTNSSAAFKAPVGEVRSLTPFEETVSHETSDTPRTTQANSDSHGVPNISAAHTPLLHLNLFGKLELKLEGVVLSNKYLTRTKIRRLIAFLALNQLRAVSRDSLMEYLWPYLDYDRAQKNLYTSWCMLSKALGSERVRDCPYIQRSGELYQLNSELVVCDVKQFEEIAREVLFGYDNRDIPFESLMQLEALYADALAADIPTDSFIGSKMENYRSLMVDALLMATRQFRGTGEAEKALFCARSAYELDESREDVYRELMDTQLGAGQRTSAMQTYFSCKRYLSDELGILPSKSTTALYQDVLLDSCR